MAVFNRGVNRRSKKGEEAGGASWKKIWSMFMSCLQYLVGFDELVD
jgi:hypothetical protein